MFASLHRSLPGSALACLTFACCCAVQPAAPAEESPVAVHVVHLTLDAPAAQDADSVAKLLEQAIQAARASSDATRHSFLITTLTGQEATAQYGRQTDVVVGETMARDRVVRSTQQIQVGALLNLKPQATDNPGQLLLQVSYECSSLQPASNEELQGRPDIKTVSVRTTLSVEPDKPQVIRLQAKEGAEYLLVTASWKPRQAPAQEAPVQEAPVQEASVQPQQSSTALTWERLARDSDIPESYLRYALGILLKYDTNRDNLLQADEQAAMNRRPGKDADANGDGVIDVYELARHFQKK